MTRLLIDAEMSMFRGLRTPVVFLQNVVVDLLLGLGFDEAFAIFADHVRTQLRRRAGLHHDEPAAAARHPRPPRDRQPDRLLQHQQDRLPDAGRPRGLRGRAARPAASGRSPCRSSPRARSRPRRPSTWVCAQPNIESIVFGASSRRNIASTRDLVDRHWAPAPAPVTA